MRWSAIFAVTGRRLINTGYFLLVLSCVAAIDHWWPLKVIAILAWVGWLIPAGIWMFGVAERYANNMRLYEATGVGTLLLTDSKQNLRELFEPGEEVVTYDGPEDLAEKIRYYLKHDEERRRIAAAGQARTLREHTYARRMKELVQILERALA